MSKFYASIFIALSLLPSIQGHTEEHQIKQKLSPPNATPTHPPTGQIQLQPMLLALAILDIDQAYKVHKHIALSLSFTFKYGAIIIAPSLHTLLGVGLRIFPMGGVFENGLFIEPFFKGGFSSYGGEKTPFFLVQGGGKIGYGWLFDSGLSVSIAGVGYYNHRFKNTNEPHWSYSFKGHDVLLALAGLRSGPAALADFSVGYTW